VVIVVVVASITAG